MKKILSLALLITLAVFMTSFVSAVSSDNTLITGIVYYSDFNQTVDNATVIVACTKGTVTSYKKVFSLFDGSYSATYDQIACSSGDSLVVTADKNGMIGSNSGIIHENAFAGWDLAIVNVPLVPEFGFLIGMVTMISAVTVFFVIRKN